jgi:hypothetical protein
MPRIVHLASLARSGETLVLRALAAHPQVHVAHDLLPANTAAETRLFQLLRVWPGPTLPRAAVPELGPQVEVIVVKQGVFAPRAPFAGFGLVRNPYAAFCSLWNYDAKLAGHVPDDALNRRHWAELRLPRLVAWADACVPWIVPALLAEADPVRQYLRFWQARVRQIAERCRTVVAYEDFVQAPRRGLEAICAAAGLPFDDALLAAHTRWPPGTRGHGGIDLGAPVRPAPAWAPDEGVPLAPFAEAVARSPVAAYRRLYETLREAEPC